tara:strand:- start:517 stop:1056 length:540 start_codon:yes stop_codon:yes gene_type:complete
MSWRELVNWDPESYTQIEHNTQNEESKPKKSNSAYIANSAYRKTNQKDTTPQSEAPSNSAYIANSAYSISKQNPTILEERLSDLTEEEEALIDSLLSWVDTCLPGEEWTMPLDWLPDSDELRMVAEEIMRKRNPALRIWRTGKDKLVCKVWVGAEPPLTINGKTSSYFRYYHGKRIDTV